MELIGIVDSSDFKEKVLHERELLVSINRIDISQTKTNDEQILDILGEIKDILNDIKNK